LDADERRLTPIKKSIQIKKLTKNAKHGFYSNLYLFLSLTLSAFIGVHRRQNWFLILSAFIGVKIGP